MIRLIRTNSDNKDLERLVRELDLNLKERNGILQEQYDIYNVIESLDAVVKLIVMELQ